MLNQLKRKLLNLVNSEKSQKKIKYSPSVADRVFSVLKKTYFFGDKLTESQEVSLFNLSEKVSSKLGIVCSDEVNQLFLAILEEDSLESYVNIFQACLEGYEDELLSLMDLDGSEDDVVEDHVVIH